MPARRTGVSRRARSCRESRPQARISTRSTATSSIRLPSFLMRDGVCRPAAGACASSTRSPTGGRGGSIPSTPPRPCSTSRSKPCVHDELLGAADFPSIWNQAKKQGMQAALGRQQRSRRGTQPECLLRHRHDTAPDRPRRDRPHRGLECHRTAAGFRRLFSDRCRACRGRRPLYDNYCAACHGATGRISAASMSARSCHCNTSAPTAIGCTPSHPSWHSTWARPTPAPTTASGTSARPSATPTCRSTASGCARPTCTTARCRRCGTC